MRKNHFAMLCIVALSLVLAPRTTAQTTDDGWVIPATSKANYCGVTLANGRIGIVSQPTLFGVSDIVLNGVYDMNSDHGGVSRIVRGPVFTNLRLTIGGHVLTDSDAKDWHQSLDMHKAALTTQFSTADATISYTMRALRDMPYAGAVEVTVTPNKATDIEVANTPSFPSELKDASCVMQTLYDGHIAMPICTATAATRTRMHSVASCSAFAFDNGHKLSVSGTAGQAGGQGIAFRATLKAGEPLHFWLVGAVCSSRDFEHPASEAERMAIYLQRSDMGSVITRHNAEWARLWQGDIRIEGDLQAQRDVRLALYNLYSFAGEGTRLSVPPMGLSTTTGYNGHVFWDMEIWMYPPLLMLNQEMAKAAVDYRFDRLAKAEQRARMFGYDGCMFPWECDDSGEEATPIWALTGTFEHHITADVGIAYWNYYRVTRDRRWLRDEGFPLMRKVADFWVSRSERNADGSYSIKNVVGANEYAANIDDNAFTNGSAKKALEYAAAAAATLGDKADPKWTELARNMKFHYMPDGTMKENATYSGAKIKQADVNLLAYPLGIVTDRKRVEQDLRYYETKIDANGPAMGCSILAVLYAQMGERDKAYDMFKMSYERNRRPPFGVLAESANSQNPYFATGAGGMLQAVLCGFGGLRITDKGIEQLHPMLPKAWKSLTITGVGKDKKTFVVR